jgi:hypothetical protein
MVLPRVVLVYAGVALGRRIDYTALSLGLMRAAYALSGLIVLCYGRAASRRHTAGRGAYGRGGGRRARGSWCARQGSAGCRRALMV